MLQEYIVKVKQNHESKKQIIGLIKTLKELYEERPLKLFHDVPFQQAEADYERIIEQSQSRGMGEIEKLERQLSEIDSEQNPEPKRQLSEIDREENPEQRFQRADYARILGQSQARGEAEIEKFARQKYEIDNEEDKEHFKELLQAGNPITLGIIPEPNFEHESLKERTRDYKIAETTKNEYLTDESIRVLKIEKDKMFEILNKVNEFVAAVLKPVLNPANDLQSFINLVKKNDAAFNEIVRFIKK